MPTIRWARCSIDRSGVEPFLAASALVGIVAQRLVRRVCDRCLTLSDISPEERLAYETELGPGPAQFQRGQGCNFCAETGYRAARACLKC